MKEHCLTGRPSYGDYGIYEHTNLWQREGGMCGLRSKGPTVARPPSGRLASSSQQVGPWLQSGGDCAPAAAENGIWRCHSVPEKISKEGH
eukprot:1157346-Pelagomonas_calceolata.AAC.18